MNKLHITNRLIEYSGISAIFILLKSDINAQVVYTDIDPDLIISESSGGSWLDIDNNGTPDFALQNFSFTVYSFSLQETSTWKDLLAIRYNSLDAFAGVVSPPFTNVYLPDALPAHYKIGASLSWQNYASQFLDYKRIIDGVTDIGSYCFWYNTDTPEILDHYLGIRFIDIAGQNHYGWIRCSVEDEGRTLIIKDYAYESSPDIRIIAGDTVGINSDFVGNKSDFETAISESELLKTNIYSFNHTVYIDLPGQINGNVDIHIYDISGREIYSTSTEKQFNEITLHQPPGIYMVTLKTEGNIFSKKLLIE